MHSEIIATGGTPALAALPPVGTRPPFYVLTPLAQKVGCPKVRLMSSTL